MIPVELFGINADTVERFYDELPGLVEDAFEDKPYVDALFAIEAERSLDHLNIADGWANNCLLYTSPSPRDRTRSRMPSSA